VNDVDDESLEDGAMLRGIADRGDGGMMGREGDMAVPKSNNSDGEGDTQDSRRGHYRYDAPDSDVFLNPTHGVPREGGITEGVGEEALTVVLKRPGAPSCSSTTCTTLV